jgi:hypothetical protein
MCKSDATEYLLTEIEDMYGALRKNAHFSGVAGCRLVDPVVWMRQNTAKHVGCPTNGRSDDNDPITAFPPLASLDSSLAPLRKQHFYFCCYFYRMLEYSMSAPEKIKIPKNRHRQNILVIMSHYLNYGCTLTDLITDRHSGSNPRTTHVMKYVASCPFGSKDDFDRYMLQYLATVSRYGAIVPFRLALLNLKNEDAVDVLLNRSEFGQAVQSNAVPGVSDPLGLFIEMCHHHYVITPVAVRMFLSMFIPKFGESSEEEEGKIRVGVTPALTAITEQDTTEEYDDA